jgi:hypothetical protein
MLGVIMKLPRQSDEHYRLGHALLLWVWRLCTKRAFQITGRKGKLCMSHTQIIIFSERSWVFLKPRILQLQKLYGKSIKLNDGRLIVHGEPYFLGVSLANPLINLSILLRYWWALPKFLAEGIFAKADTENNNQRIYPEVMYIKLCFWNGDVHDDPSWSMTLSLAHALKTITDSWARSMHSCNCACDMNDVSVTSMTTVLTPMTVHLAENLAANTSWHNSACHHFVLQWLGAHALCTHRLC